MNAKGGDVEQGSGGECLGGGRIPPKKEDYLSKKGRLPPKKGSWPPDTGYPECSPFSEGLDR